MQARRSNRSGLFLCACPHNGNGRIGGDDAGGRASITHAQLRPSCALNLRTSLEAPGIQGRLLDPLVPGQ